MKNSKFALLLASCLCLDLVSCKHDTPDIPNTPPDIPEGIETEITNYFLTHIAKIERLQVKQVKGYKGSRPNEFELKLNGGTYRYPDEDFKHIADSLGDGKVERTRGACPPAFELTTQFGIQSIDIFTLTDYDEEHKAGTKANDILLASYQTYEKLECDTDKHESIDIISYGSQYKQMSMKDGLKIPFPALNHHNYPPCLVAFSFSKMPKTAKQKFKAVVKFANDKVLEAEFDGTFDLSNS